MNQHVCPWWIGHLLANPLRKLLQHPQKILAPYVTPGMTVLEVGSGMGFFTIPLARLVGPEGRVIAVDIQRRMLEGVRKRARKAGVEDRVFTVLCEPDKLETPFPADFCLLFATAHEAPDTGALFRQIRSAMEPTGTLLLSEPKFHLAETEFAAIVKDAEDAGFAPLTRPTVRGSLSVYFGLDGGTVLPEVR